MVIKEIINEINDCFTNKMIINLTRRKALRINIGIDCRKRGTPASTTREKKILT